MRVNSVTGCTVWPLEAPLLDLVEQFQTAYYAPHPGPLLITLATYAAFQLPGDPLWVMLVGGPSKGKTESLNLLVTLDHVHTLSTITAAGLLSASKEKDKGKNATGGLLRAIGNRGFLSLKDFTSILSMPRETRQQTLAALREIHDGKWERGVGTDGGQTLSWEGKLGLIAACTASIDDHRAVMSAMGERFLFHRMPSMDADEQESAARKAAGNSGRESDLRSQLAEATLRFFETLPDPPARSGAEHGRYIEGLATLIARCRSAVTRDGNGREIVNIHDAESPARLSGQFTRLDAGLARIGVPASRRYGLVKKTALDCIPPVRARVLAELAKTGSAVVIGRLVTSTGYPKTTVWRAIEELRAHQVVERDGTWGSEDASDCGYRLRPEWLERWSRFPENHE
jgi:hypothetical protein